MSEVRLNHITGDWVIISTERAKRPEDFVVKKEKKEYPVFIEICPQALYFLRRPVFVKTLGPPVYADYDRLILLV